jgi:uncharacterized protein YggE
MRSFVLLILFCSFLSAQSNTRSIEVTGTGTYRTMPDLGVLTIEVSVVHDIFTDAVKGLNAKTDQLTAQLMMVGFKKENIVTTDFSVAKNIVWENNSNMEKGYIARQNITVEFPNTKERLAVIINSFMNSRNDFHFSFQFTLSPEREVSVKDELLKRAVADARSRAEVIASAAMVKLGTLRAVRYRSESQPVFPRTAMMKTMAAESVPSGGFDVKEMTLSDDVTVLWDIQ